MGKSIIPDYAQGATPEEVWAMFRESAERQKELDKKMDRYEEAWEKSRQEWEKQRLERDKEWEEQSRKWDKQKHEWDEKFGYLSNRFGEIAEHLVAPGINKRFGELGYHFGEVAPGGLKIEVDGKILTEIDLLLQNGNTVMAVEVKTKPRVKDVADHIKRLGILRDHRSKQNDQRQVEGAIAGAIFGIEEKKATIEAGLYVIEQSGDTMKISVPEDFVPRKW